MQPISQFPPLKRHRRHPSSPHLSPRYNEIEHNIFLKMQEADPILKRHRKRKSEDTKPVLKEEMPPKSKEAAEEVEMEKEMLSSEAVVTEQLQETKNEAPRLTDL